MEINEKTIATFNFLKKEEDAIEEVIEILKKIESLSNPEILYNSILDKLKDEMINNDEDDIAFILYDILFENYDEYPETLPEELIYLLKTILKLS